MKTEYITNLGHPSLQGKIVAYFQEWFSHLPKIVYNDRLYTAFLQIGVTNSEGYGFYETSLDEGRPIQPEDPVGAATIRIDHDPHHDEGDGPLNYDISQLYHQVVMAIDHPNSADHYPINGPIKSFRISIKVDEDTVLEKTWWPPHYDLVK